jgi:hypothetical protein
MGKVAFVLPAKRQRGSGHGKNAHAAKRREAAKGKKRGPGAGTITTNKPKGSKNDPNVVGEQSFYSKADGKPVKKSLANVYKILSANTAKNYYEFNSVNPMWNQYGSGNIGLFDLSLGAGSATSMPIDLHELTAVPNIVSGSVVTPKTSYRISFSSDAATGTVQPLTAGASNSFGYNALNYPLFLQNTTGATNNADSYPMSEDMWESTQIKLNLAGALTVPLTYHVYICQFKKDYLCPDVIQALSSTTSVTNANYLSEASAFWQAFAKPLITNPILLQNSSHMKDVHVLKHDVFHLEPKLSTEPAANEGTAVTFPHVKTVSYFERMNRKMDYSWEDTGGVALTPGTTGTQIDTGDVSCTVAPNKRVYLIVSCESFSTTPTAAFSTTRNGSYDIMVRHKHTRVL